MNKISKLSIFLILIVANCKTTSQEMNASFDLSVSSFPKKIINNKQEVNFNFKNSAIEIQCKRENEKVRYKYNLDSTEKCFIRSFDIQKGKSNFSVTEKIFDKKIVSYIYARNFAFCLQTIVVIENNLVKILHLKLGPQFTDSINLHGTQKNKIEEIIADLTKDNYSEKNKFIEQYYLLQFNENNLTYKVLNYKNELSVINYKFEKKLDFFKWVMFEWFQKEDTFGCFSSDKIVDLIDSLVFSNPSVRITKN